MEWIFVASGHTILYGKSTNITPIMKYSLNVEELKEILIFSDRINFDTKQILISKANLIKPIKPFF